MQNYNEVFDNLAMRRYIGIVAMGFTPVCIVWVFLVQASVFIPTSISVTYHLGARNIFVGMLVFVGAFLFAYRGHDDKEYKLSVLAGVSAWLVAFLPTSFDNEWFHRNAFIKDFVQETCKAPEPNKVTGLMEQTCFVQGSVVLTYLHILAAFILIAILYYFCRAFAKRAADKLQNEVDGSAQFTVIERRLKIYKICANGMIASAVIGLVMTRIAATHELSITLIEAGCLTFFAFSWLTAGLKYFR